MTKEKSSKGLLEEIRELKEIIDTKEKKKERKPKIFKIPAKGKISTPKIKKNWVTIIEIGENRNLNFTKQQIQDQTVMIDGVPRLATADNILVYKNKPVLIIPRYSVKPLSPSDNLFLHIPENWKDIEQKGLNIKGYKVLMDRMKRDALLTKKPIPAWVWLLGIAALIVGIWLLTSK